MCGLVTIYLRDIDNTYTLSSVKSVMSLHGLHEEMESELVDEFDAVNTRSGLLASNGDFIAIENHDKSVKIVRIIIKYNFDIAGYIC